MLVEDLMTSDVEACRPDSNLAEAAGVMWRKDCGAVPVVDEEGGVVGMITDRDICMALATRRQYASEVRVGEVMSRGVYTCTPEDDVKEALETMRGRRVRRLPVVNSQGNLAGIISLGDIALKTEKKGKSKKRVSRRNTVRTLKAVSRPHKAGGVDDEQPDEEREPETDSAETPTVPGDDDAPVSG